MPDSRTVEDKLRQEYFELLPEIRRTLLETETRVRRELLEISLQLQRYERLIVTSRIKECGSAVDALRRRQPLRDFDNERADDYSLRQLRDLAAIRVMAFPHLRFENADRALKAMLSTWTADPIEGVGGVNAPLAFKYFGTWTEDAAITAEVQIVPLLIGLFWEVEHSAIYKPTPNLRGVVGAESVIERRNDVFAALRAFESEFEAAITRSTAS